MKTVPGPKAEQGKEALLRGNESEGPHVCVLGAGRDEDCFQFPAITRMSRWLPTVDYNLEQGLKFVFQWFWNLEFLSLII